jgi:hypothetical protein
MLCDAGINKKAGTCGGVFLKLGIGARAIGMGEAFTAVAGDSNAMCWNPAGMADITTRKINFMHNEWLVGTHYEHLSYITPFNQGVLCAGMTYLGSGDIDLREDSPEKKGTYQAYDFALISGYAWKISDDMSVGITGKLLHSKIHDYDANGFALDIGFLRTTPVADNLLFGGVIQNIGSKLKFKSDGDPLPLIFKLGISYNMLENRLLTTADISKPGDNDIQVNLGWEYWVNHFLAIRAGYNSGIDEGPGVTCGIGYKHPVVNIDYAYVPYGDLEDHTHRISLCFNLW